MTDIFIPGQGQVPFNFMSARNAVEEYDPDYTLARNEHTGDWAVMRKVGPHDGQPFPIFNLGPELPPSDEIKRRLYQGDVRRRGGEIVRQIERIREERQRELRKEADDGAGTAAEGMDWFLRANGLHPSPRIFVPS